MSEPFSTEQQEYLKGFMAGVEARRGALGLPLAPAGEGGAAADPYDLARAAQDEVIAAGGIRWIVSRRSAHSLPRENTPRAPTSC